MKKLLPLLLIFIFTTVAISQQKYSFYGEVKDKTDKAPILGAIVSISAQSIVQQTDENGHFHFTDIITNTCQVNVELLGYEAYHYTVDLTKTKHLVIYLTPESISLNEVTIRSSAERKSLLSNQVVGKKFMLENNSGDFVKTLAKVPGLSSMGLGNGFSKPMIRGLGFNRVAVIDKGITQQDQQWGADHGLDIDQYDIDEVIVHKGPMSLQFGSDAIGGAIEVLPSRIPQENIYYGDVTMIGKSNNNLTGISVMNAFKRNKWYFKARYTGQRYSDYRVPANSLNYQGTILPIYKKRMKNTAGKENNISALINFSDNKIENSLNFSNVYQKNGLYPLSHGLEHQEDLLHDGSFRNIDMPNSSVNHFKLSNNTLIKFSPSLNLSIDLGYQENRRKEMELFHEHDHDHDDSHDHEDNDHGEEEHSNLAVDFRLRTYTSNVQLLINKNTDWQHTVGIQAAWMQNRIGGFEYFLPKYNQNTLGGYWLTNYLLNDRWSIQGGIRYDISHMNITQQEEDGHAEHDHTDLEEHTHILKPKFNNFSASVGTIFNIDRYQTLKINLGKSFRFPTVNELASNGVHHGAFRYEKGNLDLKPEKGYQLDLDYSIEKGIFSFSFSPFVSYFSNFIYLAPQANTGAEEMSVYKYEGSKAVLAGAEYQLHAAIFHRIDLVTTGQYVYNQNTTDKEPLPFVPPFSMRNEIAYSNKYKAIKSYRIAFEHQLYAKQNRVADYEEVTKGANIFNISANANVKITNFGFSLGLQVQNLFNKRYMNHLSFYRKLEVPELGRNIQLLLKIPFYK